MKQYRTILWLIMISILGACSNQSSFVNHLNTSFSNWNDDPYSDEVKVYAFGEKNAESQKDQLGLAWKKEQSQKVVEMVQFDFNNANVSSSYLGIIRQHAQYVQDNKKVVLRVAGHADERGSREYNISLGWKRAAAVAAYFEQYGVPKQRIMVVSYGKEKPLVSGHNPTAWAKNRRVEVFYEEV